MAAARSVPWFVAQAHDGRFVRMYDGEFYSTNERL
jgi:hypothetical protein